MCVGALLGDAPSKAEEPPTPEQVNENLEKFSGKTVVFDRMELSGNVQEGPKRFRFTVTSPAKTVFKSPPEGKQNMWFGSEGKDESMAALVRTLKPDQTYPVRLTCEIQRENKRYIAIVRRIDVAKGELAEEKAGTDINSDDQSPPNIAIREAIRVLRSHLAKAKNETDKEKIIEAIAGLESQLNRASTKESLPRLPRKD